MALEEDGGVLSPTTYSNRCSGVNPVNLGPVKLAIVADVHGNLVALEAVLADHCDIRRAYVRVIGDLTVANCGSVGLPFDGDPRASYLVVTDGRAANRRVAYDVERAAAEVLASGIPDAEGVAAVYRTARPP